ncbi:TIGR02444 family protein [Pseudomonas sp.]|uniref:TIGR02444 family protein n=1 Tax=Pseudomonas sp. TaxID=306 RepID=UPI0028A5AD21|nr:TIGR02444 family protein [Pseudomonas sp.]
MPTDLWNYALALYGQNGVETACLALQEQGADVCLLLCATWLQARRVAPSEGRAQALRAICTPWQEQVVAPLREVRRGWKAMAQDDSALASLRERVKQLELDAERALLERLAHCAAQWPVGDGEGGDWLAWLAPPARQHHDALAVLRVAAQTLYASDD